MKENKYKENHTKIYHDQFYEARVKEKILNAAREERDPRRDHVKMRV